MNDQHNTSGSSHTSWTYFPESDDKPVFYVMRISTSSCMQKRSCQSILTPPAISTGTSLTPAIMVRVSVLLCLHWCTSCSSPELIFVTSITLSYILFFMLERLTCVDAACTLLVAGSKCGAHKKGEWLIIGRTLFSSTHWCFINRKCPHMSSASRNMESSTSRVTTEYELKNG